MGRYQALRELHQPRAKKTMIVSPSCDTPCDSSGHATLVTNAFYPLDDVVTELHTVHRMHNNEGSGMDFALNAEQREWVDKARALKPLLAANAVRYDAEAAFPADCPSSGFLGQQAV